LPLLAVGAWSYGPGVTVGDTSPEAMARYAERLRALDPAQRLAIAAGLTQGVRSLAEAGIRLRHPEAGEEEIRCRLAALLYGHSAAERLFGSVPPDVP
jgi:hypothetical protein